MACRRWIGRKLPSSILLRQIIGLILIGLLVGGISQPLQVFWALPPQVKVSVGERLQIPLELPEAIKNRLSFRINRNQEIGKVLSFNSPREETFDLKKLPVVEHPGTIDLEVCLFGLIPIKKMVVTVTSPVYVVPGGQSIGVFFRTSGLIILNYAPIRDTTGQELSPGKRGGLLPGDIILQADGQELVDEFDLAKIVNLAGQRGDLVHLVIERDTEKQEVRIKPVYCPETTRYRIGLLVRDNSAGVGTLTFYLPETQVYAALGHVIVDSRTNQEIDISKGKIVPAQVQGIQPGRRGNPGEKIGVLEDKTPLGTIEKNSPYGIYGRLSQPAHNPWFTEPIPVAWRYQVHEGMAQILTVVKGNQIEVFNVQIEKVMPERLDGKGMIIRVIDPQLINTTGGIIQGMSGSPIIQDGRLIGAVTHVFVNDPTRGYALMAEYMLSEMNQFTDPTTVGQKVFLADNFLFFIYIISNSFLFWQKLLADAV